MVLQNSGPISLNDIQTEFGGTNPISIDEYYGVATGIPASGEISFDIFYGASAVPPEGQEWFLKPGTYTFTVPDGVTFMSAVVVGGGGGSAIARGEWAQ